MIVFSFAAVLFYCGASILFFRYLGKDSRDKQTRSQWLLMSLGLLNHGALLYMQLGLSEGVDLRLGIAASLVTWSLALILGLVAIFRPVEILGIAVLPLAVLVIVYNLLFPGEIHFLPTVYPIARFHLLIAILSFGCLGLAVLQSIAFSWQDFHLRAQHMNPLVGRMPPLQTMESIMFQLLNLGFILLTITLLTGVFFHEAISGRPFELNHHILLSLIAWIIFAVLLVGRQLFGWRGRTAARLLLSGFVTLVLGYFGTRFVLEVILGRSP